MRAVIFGAAVVLVIGANLAHGSTIGECGKNVHEVLTSDASAKEKRVLLEKLEGECGDHAAYLQGYGDVLIVLGDSAGAERVYRDGLQAHPAKEKEFKFGLVRSNIQKLDLNTARDFAVELIDEYPSWYGGFLGLGHVMLLVDKPNDALELLRKGNSLQETSQAAVLLTVVYALLDMNPEVVVSFKRAASIRPSVIYDEPDAVIATVFSLIRLGHVDEAEELYLEHVSYRPQSSKLGNFVKAKAYFDRQKGAGE